MARKGVRGAAFQAGVARRQRSLSTKFTPGRAALKSNAVQLPINFRQRFAVSTPGFDEINNFLYTFRKSNIDNIIPSGAMRAAIQGIAAGVKDNFQRKQGPDGPWEPLLPSTARFRARQGYQPYGPELVRGGSLKKAIEQFDRLVMKGNESGASETFSSSIRADPSIRDKARTTKKNKPAKRNPKMDKKYKSPRTRVEIQYGSNTISAKTVTKFAEIKISGPSVALNNGYTMSTKKGLRHVPARPFWYVSEKGRAEMEIFVKNYLAGHMGRDVRQMIESTKRSKGYLHELGTQENKSLIAMRTMSKERRALAFQELYHAALRGKGLRNKEGKDISSGWRKRTRKQQVEYPEDMLGVTGVMAVRRIAEEVFMHKRTSSIEHYMDMPSGQVIHRYRVKVGDTTEYRTVNFGAKDVRSQLRRYQSDLESGRIVGLEKRGSQLVFTAPGSTESETVPLAVIIKRSERGMVWDASKRRYVTSESFKSLEMKSPLRSPAKNNREQELEDARLKEYHARLAINLLAAQMEEQKRLRSMRIRNPEYTGGIEGVKRTWSIVERHDVFRGAYAFRIHETEVAGLVTPKTAEKIVNDAGETVSVYHPKQSVSGAPARKSSIDEALEIIMGRKMTSDNELIAQALGRRGRDFGDAILAIRAEIMRREAALKAQYADNRDILAQIERIPLNERYDAFFAPDGTMIVNTRSGKETVEGGWSSRVTRHTMAVRMIEWVPEQSSTAVKRMLQEMFGHWDQEYLRTYIALSRYGSERRAPGQIWEKPGHSVKVIAYEGRVWEDWQKERNRIVWMQRTLRMMEYFAQRAWEETYYRNVEIRIQHEMGMYYNALNFGEKNEYSYPYYSQARRKLEDIKTQIEAEEKLRDDSWSAIAGEAVYGPRFFSRRRELGWLMNYDDFNNVFWDGYTKGMKRVEQQRLLGPNGIGIDIRETTPAEGRAYLDRDGQWYAVNRPHVNFYNASRGMWGITEAQARIAGLRNSSGTIEAEAPIHIVVAGQLKSDAESAFTMGVTNITLSQAWMTLSDQDILRDEMDANRRVLGIKRQKGTFGGAERRPSWWAGQARAAQKQAQLFSRSEIDSPSKKAYQIVPFNSYQAEKQASAGEAPIRRKMYYDAFMDTFSRYGWLVEEEVMSDPKRYLGRTGLGATRVRDYLYGRKGVEGAAYRELREVLGKDSAGKYFADYSADSLRELLSREEVTASFRRMAWMVYVSKVQKEQAKAAERSDKARRRQ